MDEILSNTTMYLLLSILNYVTAAWLCVVPLAGFSAGWFTFGKLNWLVKTIVMIAGMGLLIGAGAIYKHPEFAIMSMAVQDSAELGKSAKAASMIWFLINGVTGLAFLGYAFVKQKDLFKYVTVIATAGALWGSHIVWNTMPGFGHLATVYGFFSFNLIMGGFLVLYPFLFGKEDLQYKRAIYFSAGLFYSAATIAGYNQYGMAKDTAYQDSHQAGWSGGITTQQEGLKSATSAEEALKRQQEMGVTANEHW